MLQIVSEAFNHIDLGKPYTNSHTDCIRNTDFFIITTFFCYNFCTDIYNFFFYRSARHMYRLLNNKISGNNCWTLCYVSSSKPVYLNKKLEFI